MSRAGREPMIMRAGSKRAHTSAGTTADVLTTIMGTVRSHPDALALTDGTRELSYRKLAACCVDLAAKLRRAGVRAERIVGLLGPEPLDVVVAMLAVLRCGGAFAVIDPALPADAARRVVDRLGAVPWVGRGPRPTPLLQTHNAYLNLDRDLDLDPPTPAGPDGRVVDSVTQDQLAYVMFTSGSTGEPKGVMITRGGLSSFADALRSRLALTPSDRWLQVASIGFDVLIEEVFPILSAGGTVVCRSSTEPLYPEALHQLLDAHCITVLELSNQHWYEYRRWLAREGVGPPRALRALIVGGEAMDPRAYADWQRRYAVHLLHVYGLTECSVSSTLFDGRIGIDDHDVPIGTPLANTTVAVHADQSEPGPDATEGEILIGGAGVARGYLGDPRLTALRFRPDPDAAVPGARVYCTGDRGRLAPGGDLVFVGRDDAQVKVRGHRLELTEVDQALQSDAAVARAAAVLDPVTQSLVAFVVPEEPDLSPTAEAAVPLAADIREALVAGLTRTLPEWAVPGRFVAVAGLPTTTNGKLDRQALLRRERAQTPSPTKLPPLLADADSTTWRIVEAFRIVLGDDSIGPDDDFFVRGGNSILAMRLVTELRARLSKPAVRAVTLFDHPTPRRLAESIT